MAGYEASSECNQEREHSVLQAQSSRLPRILVVEHDQSVAELILAVLKSEGYELTLASSLDSALERLDEQAFNLVLTDLFVEVPRRPFAQVRRLLQHSLLTPVGLMTGWQISPEAARRQGFAFLVQKPFDLEPLLAEIDSCLQQKITPEQERQFQAVKRFLAALNEKNREALGRLLTEDFTYYAPPQAVAASGSRVKGLAGLLAYVQESRRRYQNVAFDNIVFYPRPRGWGMRYSSHWSVPGGPRQNLAGALLFHFRGDRIHQVGIKWCSKRLQALLGT